MNKNISFPNLSSNINLNAQIDIKKTQDLFSDKPKEKSTSKDDSKKTKEDGDKFKKILNKDKKTQDKENKTDSQAILDSFFSPKSFSNVNNDKSQVFGGLQHDQIEKIADKILASNADLNKKPEVIIKFNTDVLKGTDVHLAIENGKLNVQFNSNFKESIDMLKNKDNMKVLRKKLENVINNKKNTFNYEMGEIHVNEKT